jgi:hypothetical protein
MPDRAAAGRPHAGEPDGAELRFLKRKGFSDKRLAQAAGHATSTRCASAPRAGRAPGLQARGHLRGRVRHADGLHVLDLRRGVRGRAHHAQEDHGAGRRAQPHRPGHRVRLLLRARRAGHARGRLRDHHGQLQPGDRVDRLRHQRPPVLRAGDAGRRARDRRQGEARGRDRAVRRPDAAEAGARPRARRRAHHRHQPRQHRHRRGPRALPAAAARPGPEAAAQPHRAHRGAGAGAGAGDRLPAGGAPELRAGRPRDGDRARRQGPGALHARGRAREREVARCCSTASSTTRSRSTSTASATAPR